METTVTKTRPGDVKADYASIEKMLAELWRVEKRDGDTAVTRAALWNVVAHTSHARDHGQASETLARAAAAVPQRTIVIRADPEGEPEISTWLSANCHLVGGGKQVCSEEIAIVAGGNHVHRVPPLVHALLMPDMPVAVWWVGDLPSEHAEYVDSILEPADRLIVDSAQFDEAGDLDLLARVAKKTTTLPADLNWVRLEEWRTATATLFDPPELRRRVREIRSVRIVSRCGDDAHFGGMAGAVLYAGWLSAQLGHGVDGSGKVEGPLGAIDYRFERNRSEGTPGIVRVEFTFADEGVATVAHEEEMSVISTTTSGASIRRPDCVTRTIAKGTDELLVRQLRLSEGDRLLMRALPVARLLAQRVAA